MEEDRNKCLECGRALYGRPDKKFCNTSCKNRFNARIHTRERQVRNKTINVLLHNHRILEDLLEKGVTSADLDDLTYNGFVPSCITGCRKGRYRHDEISCFELRYYQSENRIFNLHKAEEK